MEESSRMNGQDLSGTRRALRVVSAPLRMARLPLRFTFLERVESSSKMASLTQWLRISQPPQWLRMISAKNALPIP